MTQREEMNSPSRVSSVSEVLQACFLTSSWFGDILSVAVVRKKEIPVRRLSKGRVFDKVDYRSYHGVFNFNKGNGNEIFIILVIIDCFISVCKESCNTHCTNNYDFE